VHQNFVEVVASVIAFILLGGIYLPIASAVMGLIFMIGRALFCFYLNPKGANHLGRMLGAIICDVVELGGLVLSILSGLYVIGVLK